MHTRNRASNSGVALNETDAGIIKGMLLRGDRQHDIASWFGVNAGRISEIANGRRFTHVPPTLPDDLPSPGPYELGRKYADAVTSLLIARVTVEMAIENLIEIHESTFR